MTLVVFGIAVVIILAFLYVLHYVIPTPSKVVQVIIDVVAGLVVFFMALSLFGVIDLPFKLS